MIGKVFVLALLASVSLAEVSIDSIENPEDQSLIVVSSSNWDAVRSKGPIFVKMYAPWCGHCVALAPIWDDLAEKLEGQVAVAKVDCTVESSICSSEGAEGYPTLKFISASGHSIKYEGPRNLESLMQFAKRMSGPSVKEVASLKEWKKFVNENGDYATLLVLPQGATNFESAVANFQDACSQVKDKISCAQTKDAELLALAKADKSKEAFVVLYKESEFIPTGPGDLIQDPSKLAQVMLRNRFATMTQVTPETYSGLVNSGRKLVIAVLDPVWKSKEKWLALITSIAKKELKGEDVLFSWIDGVQWHDFTGQYGVRVDSLPQFLIQDGPDGQHWTSPLEMDVFERAAVVDWLLGVAQGKIAGKGGSIITSFWNLVADYAPFFYENPMLLGITAAAIIIGSFVLCCFGLSSSSSSSSGEEEGDDEKDEQKKKKQEDKKKD